MSSELDSLRGRAKRDEASLKVLIGGSHSAYEAARAASLVVVVLVLFVWLVERSMMCRVRVAC